MSDERISRRVKSAERINRARTSAARATSPYLREKDEGDDPAAIPAITPGQRSGQRTADTDQ